MYGVSKNKANWEAYAVDNPNNPTLSHLTEMIEEATDIINENISSYNVDIVDLRFLSRVQKLCLRMVNRMRQIELGQGLRGKIPMFSPNDFLIDRERNYLRFVIGVTLGYRSVGDVSG